MNTKLENNKLKQDNNNLKLEIELMKNNLNNQNNQIGGLQMQIMNMMNQMQQQIYNIMQTINKMKNEFNSLSYSVNNSNLTNQFNNNSNFMNFSNNLNLMNKYNLDKNNQFNSINNNNQSENKITIIFHNYFLREQFYPIDPINKELFLRISKIEKILKIENKPEDEVYELIEKYFEKVKINECFKKYFFFVYNARRLNISLTLKELGINDQRHIFVLIQGRTKINFKISNDYLYIKSGICCLDRITVFELIYDFLDETGIKEEDIKNYFYNNKILNQSIFLQQAGLYDNSDIIVNMNRPIQYIKIILKSKEDQEIIDNINCLKTEKIISIKRKIENIINIKDCNLFLEKEKKGNSYGFLEFKKIEYDEKTRAEEIGLKNNSVLYFE